jgi:CheY-like chemotaxis protein
VARILVVDDNPTNLDLMTYLLGAFGHQTTGVADGAAALEAVQNGAFALVLTDILMPGMDGYELARQLKSDPRLASTPLVAVTALAMPGDREHIDAMGFDGYIAKPIDPQRFVSEVDGYLKI